MGYASETFAQDGTPVGYGDFLPGTPQSTTYQGNTYAPALAYQVNLANNGSATADVTGFAVVFYDASRNEAGSDQQGASDFIVAGQSLNWVEIATDATDGTGTDTGTDGSIPANAVK